MDIFLAFDFDVHWIKTGVRERGSKQASKQYSSFFVITVLPKAKLSGLRVCVFSRRPLLNWDFWKKGLPLFFLAGYELLHALLGNSNRRVGKREGMKKAATNFITYQGI